MKRWETPELRKLKARIVLWGDDILVEEDNPAPLQEAKVTPTGMTGVNINLAYGALREQEARQSDVVKAYTHSYVGSKAPTWVILLLELTPAKYRHMKQPCVKLVSLQQNLTVRWADSTFDRVFDIVGNACAAHEERAQCKPSTAASLTISDFEQKWILASNAKDMVT